MTRSRGVEKRLFEAVMVVLASSGCYTAPPPQAPQPSPAPTPAEPPSDGRDPWAVPPEEPPPPAPPTTGPPAPPSGPNANQLCASHKKRTLPKVPPLPKGPHANGRTQADTSLWNGSRGVAVCTIIRDTRTIDVTVTYTPRCCPSPDPHPQPCPGPTTHVEQGKALLVERAEVAPDGSAVSSSLRWEAIEPYRQPQPYCGRLPEGAQALGEDDHELGDPCGGDAARLLASMAELEAASVPAFARLARELAAHGAPAELVRRADAARRDELRHARAMHALADRRGGSPRPIAVAELPCRSLVAIAIENVVEGCVREAYGALVATYQAERAAVELRPVFRAIARDERRHAALAEDVHAWIVARLDAGEQRRVTAARTRAEAELRAALPAMPTCDELGMPRPQEARALFESYFAS